MTLVGTAPSATEPPSSNVSTHNPVLWYAPIDDFDTTQYVLWGYFAAGIVAIVLLLFAVAAIPPTRKKVGLTRSRWKRRARRDSVTSWLHPPPLLVPICEFEPRGCLKDMS